MTRTEFRDEIAAMLDVRSDELTPGFALDSVDAWDSVAVLSLLVIIDERLGIAVRPDSLSRIATFGDLVGLVEQGFTE